MLDGSPIDLIVSFVSRRKPAPPADGPPTVPTDDAIRYVATVKREFAGETGKYEEFLAVLRQCRGGRFVTIAC